MNTVKENTPYDNTSLRIIMTILMRFLIKKEIEINQKFCSGISTFRYLNAVRLPQFFNFVFHPDKIDYTAEITGYSKVELEDFKNSGIRRSDFMVAVSKGDQVEMSMAEVCHIASLIISYLLIKDLIDKQELLLETSILSVATRAKTEAPKVYAEIRKMVEVNSSPSYGKEFQAPQPSEAKSKAFQISGTKKASSAVVCGLK